MEKEIRATLSADYPNKPTLNEWMKEFNVASRYVESQSPPDSYIFDLKKFKKTLKEKKWVE